MTKQVGVPPLAEVRPVTFATGGVEWVDPYAWLEAESAEALAWQATQNAFTEHRLRDVEGFGALRDPLDRHLGETFLSAPRGCGGRWFRAAHGDGGGRLELADGPTGP